MAPNRRARPAYIRNGAGRLGCPRAEPSTSSQPKAPLGAPAPLCRDLSLHLPGGRFRPRRSASPSRLSEPDAVALAPGHVAHPFEPGARLGLFAAADVAEHHLVSAAVPDPTEHIPGSSKRPAHPA